MTIPDIDPNGSFRILAEGQRVYVEPNKGMGTISKITSRSIHVKLDSGKTIKTLSHNIV